MKYCIYNFCFSCLLFLLETLFLRHRSEQQLKALTDLAPIVTNIEEPKNIIDGYYNIKTLDVSLPLISLLFERSPYSNLILSPAVNQRQVEISSLVAVTDKQQRSVLSALYDEEDNTSFASRKIIVFPYKFIGFTNKGSKLFSIAKHFYEPGFDGVQKQSVTASVENARAGILGIGDYKCAFVFFNVPMSSNPNNLNFNGLLCHHEDLNSNENLECFLTRCALPLGIMDHTCLLYTSDAADE